MFNIKQTPYGGRGLFASTPIPKDTLIMKSNPYAHVIYHVFRKEVCGFCFAYSLDGVPRKNTWTIKHCGAWFCSPSCLSEWITEWTVPGTEMISDISVGFERIKRKNSDELTQLELDTSKFVLSALIYQSLHPHQPRTSLLDLQDNEIPYSRVQGDSHIRLIYGFIRQIIQHASPKTRQALSPLIESNERIRELLGRDGNAFGIYDVDGSQILGFGLYISASYFNHSMSNPSLPFPSLLMLCRLHPKHQETLLWEGDILPCDERY